MAGTLGIEPRLTESKSVVLPLHNVPTKLVEDNGFEPFASACKADVLAKYTNPPKKIQHRRSATGQIRITPSMLFCIKVL